MKKICPQSVGLRLNRLILLACFGWLLSGTWVATAQAGVTVTSKTKGSGKTLALSFPDPGNSSTAPQLLVIPLLGGGRSLLPGGKLLVWVGRSDGTSLADVPVVVRAPGQANTLASAGSRVESVTVRTDTDGIATAYFAAPEAPKPPGDDGSGGGGGGE